MFTLSRILPRFTKIYTMSSPLKRSISKVSASEPDLFLLISAADLSGPVKKRRRASSSPELVEIGSEWGEWPAPSNQMEEARKFILDM